VLCWLSSRPCLCVFLLSFFFRSSPFFCLLFPVLFLLFFRPPLHVSKGFIKPNHNSYLGKI
jgi:hypothetical protein